MVWDSAFTKKKKLKQTSSVILKFHQTWWKKGEELTHCSTSAILDKMSPDVFKFPVSLSKSKNRLPLTLSVEFQPEAFFKCEWNSLFIAINMWVLACALSELDFSWK